LRAGSEREVDVPRRMTRTQLHERGHEPRHAELEAGAEREAQACSRLAGDVATLNERLQGRTCASEQRLAIGRERDATRRAIEQPAGELGLELLDALAQGGGGERDLGGGATKIELLGRRDEAAQAVDRGEWAPVHARRWYSFLGSFSAASAARDRGCSGTPG